MAEESSIIPRCERNEGHTQCNVNNNYIRAVAFSVAGVGAAAVVAAVLFAVAEVGELKKQSAQINA